jgi:NAD(P)-dependent dehydrogenase (short-subunit alcohol dehydrogenase family)
MPLEGLKGRKALVTGAASGIGSSIVSRLEREGVRVVATDIHPKGDLFVADLTAADDVEKLSAKTGTPDFLINVAGGPIAPSRDNTLPPIPGAIALEDLKEKDWNSVIAANLTTAFLVCREFAPRMKARKFGRIVNFASIAARRGSDRVGVHYAAAKGGILGLTKTLALELGPHGITANAVAPGEIATKMTGQEDEDPRSKRRDLPVPRPGDAREIAAMVAFLASPESVYTTGQSLIVDGGMSLMGPIANRG